MTLKNQFKKIKENWLIILLFAVALFFVSGADIGGKMGLVMPQADMKEMAVSRAYGGMAPAPYYDEGFAPEIEERKITKTATLSTEVDRGDFAEADQKLRTIVSSSDSFLLNENINTYGKRDYKQGSYEIRVEVDKYNSVLSQLKEIGEIQSFWENAQDITARYTDTSVELEAEKARLDRYKAMLDEADRAEDKINLADRIFDLERTIKYLEQSVNRMDQKVEYSTISVTITEKESGYVDIVFVKLSELIGALVSSINSLLYLIFLVLPYAVAIGIIYGVYRLVKKK
ncbi:DUF4349 domain-containing protein [Candidatus Woesearchaeota archaeon]|nr:DUF4349 domain-containing protein [Candidatus Woesearchaeota archaeon]